MSADGAMGIAAHAPERGSGLRKEDFQIFGGQPYEDFATLGFRPRPDLPPLRLAPPLDWSADPFSDNNWCFQLHAWRMLQPLWTQFFDKDWHALLTGVLPWIRDWHAFHVRDQRESSYAWHDMASGLRAQHLALLLHLEQLGTIALDGEDRAIVVELARMHVAKFREPGYISSLNHGIFQVVGLRLLGIVGQGWAECDGEKTYSTALMRRLVESQFTPAGVHVDNSPFYHDYIFKLFRRVRPALFPGIEDLLSDRLSKAAGISPWLSMPDGKLAAIGDSEGHGIGLKLPHGEPDLVTAAGTPIVVRDLSAGGYVMVRSTPKVALPRASMLIVNGTAFSKTHAHADHLGFELFHQGRKLFVDSGKYTYNNQDRWRDYFLSDRAHNVVGLRGKSFSPQDTRTAGTALQSCVCVDGVVEIRGEVVRSGYFRHERRLVYRPEHSLVIFDRVKARPWDAPVSYLHVAPGLHAVPRGDAVQIRCADTIVARVRLDPDGTVRLIAGQEDPEVQGWVSASYLAKEPAWVIECRYPRGRKAFVTRIELTDDDLGCVAAGREG